MELPQVQIKENNSLVSLFWDVVADPAVQSFTLYWSEVSDTSYTENLSDPSRLSFLNYRLVKEFIPNTGVYGRRSTMCSFKRSDLGLDESKSFYVGITARRSDQVAETPLGTPKFIPYLSDQPVQAGSVQSPITRSQRFRVGVGTAPTRLKFSTDVMQLEVFNFSQTAPVFLDATGLEASADESMPLMPLAYYVIGRQLSKDTGISLVSTQEGVDVRVMAHY